MGTSNQNEAKKRIEIKKKLREDRRNEGEANQRNWGLRRRNNLHKKRCLEAEHQVIN